MERGEEWAFTASNDGVAYEGMREAIVHVQRGEYGRLEQSDKRDDVEDEQASESILQPVDVGNQDEEDERVSIQKHSTGTLPKIKRRRMTPPTYEEIQQLRDSADLFKMNLFKLQVRACFVLPVSCLESQSGVNHLTATPCNVSLRKCYLKSV